MKPDEWQGKGSTKQPREAGSGLPLLAVGHPNTPHGTGFITKSLKAKNIQFSLKTSVLLHFPKQKLIFLLY